VTAITRPSRLRGLVPRLVAINAVVSVIIIGLALVLALRIAGSVARNQSEKALAGAAHAFAAELVSVSSASAIAGVARSYLATGAISPGETVVIVIAGGPTLSSSRSTGILRLRPVSQEISGRARTGVAVTADSGNVMVLVEPILRDNRVVADYVVSESLTHELSQIHLLEVIIVSLGAAALVVSIVGASIILRRVARSVDLATKTALEISEGDTSRRLPVTGRGDEIDRLSRAFNSMISRVSGTLASQRALMGDVSHQLRTPLTVMRGNLEMLQREMRTRGVQVGSDEITAIEAEIGYMTDLVDRLVYLERLTQFGTDRVEPIDVRALILDCLTSVRVTADRDWQVDQLEDIVIEGDAAALRGALLNLCENAVHATQPGVRILLGATRGGLDEIIFYVKDEGPGVPPEAQSEIFKRFRREGAGGRGAGLGLAIVKAVAEAHGGRVDLVSEVGKGSLFAIVLPASLVVAVKGELHDTSGNGGR